MNGKPSVNFDFPVNDNPAGNLHHARIWEKEITDPTDTLTTFRNLIFLKDDVKGIGTNAQNRFNFE